MRRLYEAIRLDFIYNPHKVRIRVLLILFRISNYLYGFSYRIVFFPIFVLYRLFSEWACSIELRPGTVVGAPLIIDHG